MTTRPTTTTPSTTTPSTATPSTTKPSTATPSSTTTRAVPSTSSTRLLLGAGVVAGPIFVLTAGIQALTREGFTLAHQPLSMLSLGDLGWIQITNFVLAGLLSLAFAAGVKRRLTSGPGHVWAPLLFAVFGIGLLIGGAFVPDPALGYPPGTPDEIPSTMSAHALLHAVAPPLAFLALVAACFVVARRFSSEGRRTAAISTRVVGVACLLLAIPVGPGFSWRLFLSIALGFAWIAVLAAFLIRARAIDGRTIDGRTIDGENI